MCIRDRIICGMAFGRESGFLCGSLSAVVSNFFFGQGPWTPFQTVSYTHLARFVLIIDSDRMVLQEMIINLKVHSKI